MLQLFFPEILFKFTYCSQNYSHILEIISKKAALLNKIHANKTQTITNKYLK